MYLVGTPPEEEGLDSLLKESDLHGDLAISGNVDTYQNLTLKTLSAFRWMQTFCPGADFILKIDDDMFIQTQRLRQLVMFENSDKKWKTWFEIHQSIAFIL